MNMVESYLNGLSTLWEKEKLLVTSNFSFSHSVFKRIKLQTRKNQGLFGKGLMVNKKTTRKREKLGQVEKICMRYENSLTFIKPPAEGQPKSGR